MESCVMSRRRLKELSLTVIFFFFLFVCFCATNISSHNPQFLSESMYLWSTKAAGKERKRYNVITSIVNDKTPLKIGGARGRLLGGLGSSPPRCTSKCGRCTPCKPVLVPATPRASPVMAECYPEAWRCRCGNKLYILMHA